MSGEKDCVTKRGSVRITC